MSADESELGKKAADFLYRLAVNDADDFLNELVDFLQNEKD